MKSSRNKIETKILKSSFGEIFFLDDFASYGSSDNIRKVLSRLVQEGLIERLSQGIYLKPKKDPILGTLYPTTEEIAKQIAQRDKARIAPTGVLALYLLGLTTQVPLKVVYLSDGSQREINIGNRTIQFKKTVPKSFAIKDKLLHLIVQAFKEMGQKEVNDNFLGKIKPSVLEVNDQVIQKQLKYAPVWIQKHINNLNTISKNVD
ncbi:type IV toxin-antitoxin system AbiEi family antitoxin domain-containing protein [Empedobacter falsenii]